MKKHIGVTTNIAKVILTFKYSIHISAVITVTAPENTLVIDTAKASLTLSKSLVKRLIISPCGL